MLNQVFEQYRALSLQIKLALLVAIAGIVAYMSYSDCVSVAESSLAAAKSADEQLSNELNNFNRGGNSLAAIESQKRKAEEDLVRLFELLPKDEEIEKLLADFANSARDSGIEMIQFVPGNTSQAQASTSKIDGSTPAAAMPGNTPTATKSIIPASSFSVDSLHKIPLNVKLKGTYSQIATFFDRILSMSRIVRLENFGFKSDTESVAVSLPAGMNSGSVTRTRTAPDGSPILSVEAQFITFTQKGETPNFAALAPKSVPKPTSPVPISEVPAHPEGLSAKPLPAGNSP